MMRERTKKGTPARKRSGMPILLPPITGKLTEMTFRCNPQATPSRCLAIDRRLETPAIHRRTYIKKSD
jgi:hypothetical protein